MKKALKERQEESDQGLRERRKALEDKGNRLAEWEKGLKKREDCLGNNEKAIENEDGIDELARKVNSYNSLTVVSTFFPSWPLSLARKWSHIKNVYYQTLWLFNNAIDIASAWLHYTVMVSNFQGFRTFSSNSHFSGAKINQMLWTLQNVWSIHTPSDITHHYLLTFD